MRATLAWLAALGLVGLGAFAVYRASQSATGARAAYEAKDYQAAEQLAREQLRAQPGDTDALRWLARATARLGRDDAAKSLYGKLSPSAWEREDHFLLGRLIDRAGDLNLAVKTWNLALAAAPDDPETLDALALADRRGGQVESAAGHAERLARQPGWSARGEFLLGELRAELSELDAAASAYRRSLASKDTSAPPRVEVAKRLARVELRRGKPGEAAGALKAVGLSPGIDLEADWLFARSALQEGDYQARSHERAAAFRGGHPVEPEPAPFVGAAACAGCHRAATLAVSESRHARTFTRAESIDLKARALAPIPTNVPDPAAPERAVHTLRRDAAALVVDSTIDGTLYRAVVDYAFGSGDRGLTLVGHDAKGRPCELRLSRYADPAGWDVTNGQDARPGPATSYLGKLLGPDQVRRCLDCHTTEPRAARDRTGPTASDHAIGCERCHGPGGHHEPAVENGLPDLAIAAGRKGLSGPEVTRLCGQCHASRGPTLRKDNPFGLRFQADTLTWSRCYISSDGALSCLTCHDPHRDAESAPAFYSAKCLACHQPGPSATSATICPVNPKADCVRCHMPSETAPAIPHTRFTDHFIRVHKN